ncbi:AI-2E family transporter [Zafaria sp. Z1313]|uniref:AI-2E family transporter n=1 Tax=unclassified Zafaria TaxID=2828765 RepID=UPI002E77BB3C|nr:AI-2E family transporter [Zafaria sp. J156]MEE1620180.1 AI-2E family transporter [Zafaria sp. J156]
MKFLETSGRGGPYRLGFVATLGVLTALALGAAVITLKFALTLIFVAFFVSLGLDPLVRWLERRKLSRTGAVLAVMLGFVLIVALLLRIVVPILVEQGTSLIALLPQGFGAIAGQAWFVELNAGLGDALTPLLEWLERASTDPEVWLAIGGGALQVGINVVNAGFAVLFVVVLTLYFVAGMESIKSSFYALVPASRREEVAEISETIAESVGKYLSGMAVLAALNAVFTFTLLSIVGVRYAAVLAVLAFPITLIPLVGSVISTTLITIVSLFTSPGAALVVLLVMLVYMQVEAYVLTPRIVGKAISIPGSLVLIGAMVGGTLLGLLGALIACPTTASILLILKKVVIPAQNAR